MSVTSAKTGSTSLSLALENNFMEPIASTLVGSGGSGAIEFNDIPQTYKHLQIRCFVKASTTSSAIQIILNSDANSASYYRHQVWGNGGAVAASSGTNAYIGPVNLSGTANIFSASITDILDYANTNKYKTGRVISGNDTNNAGNAVIEIDSFLWMNTNPISSIQLKSDVGTFSQYSRFSLYGIKG